MKRIPAHAAIAFLSLGAITACQPEGRQTLATGPSQTGAPAGYRLVADPTPPSQWPAAEKAILSNIRQLTNPDMGLAKSGEAYFSPDMSRIIFQAYPEGESEYQIFTLELTPNGDAKKDTLRQVSPGGGACTCGFFKPDGSGIMFCSSHLNPDLPNPNLYQRQGGRYAWEMPAGMDIFEADLDGSNLRRITTQPSYDAECAYNPTGRLIVFASDRDGDPDIYVMNADGTGVRQLTNAPGYDGGPFFSPEGDRIIFRADRKQDDHLQIFLIDVDGTNERQLTRHSPFVNWAPFWLPNGRSIVFTSSIHGHWNYEVYLLNVDTGKHQRVTYSPRFDGLPVISPDGRRLMWTSQRGPSGTSQIFLADFQQPDGF